MDSKLSRRLFDVLYPLCVYYILYYCLQFLFLSIWVDSFGSLFCVLLAAIVCLPVEVFFYRHAVVERNASLPVGRQWIGCAGWVIGAVLLGVAINLAVSHLPLTEVSAGYSEASEVLRDGSLWVRILANALVVPALEETLYRGLICGQMEAWGTVGRWQDSADPHFARKMSIVAVVVSAFLFGAFHFNVVQFLYAFVMGLFLGMAYVRTHRLWVVILAHGLTNLVVLLATLS